jgi:hypothetical protein
MTLCHSQVKPYLDALLGAAESTAEAVASLQECLEFFTRVMRGRLGDYLDEQGIVVDRKKVKTAPPGVVASLEDTKAGSRIQLGDGQAAARALMQHHQLRESLRPQDPRSICSFNYLEFPPEVLQPARPGSSNPGDQGAGRGAGGKEAHRRLSRACSRKGLGAALSPRVARVFTTAAVERHRSEPRSFIRIGTTFTILAERTSSDSLVEAPPQSGRHSRPHSKRRPSV